ncbi:hypothetical protein F53441_10639 [Fusarium austroafricanum]|uniref:Uncharacterized protein n=1 Tax=Fusarium austroafricanum TaxID=2364996 RepID=A0A8H4K984_9HYPO|nr:hypothetical protein F53441_10639 [Fusarium austroafricanum]
MTTTSAQLETQSHSPAKAPTPSISISPKDCTVHGDSETPHLDRLLQNRPKAELQGLADAVESLAHGDQCAKCAVQAAVTIITGFTQELYTAKKSGKLSKEDKKALKSEVKGLVKGMKGDIKMQKKELKAQ